MLRLYVRQTRKRSGKNCDFREERAYGAFDVVRDLLLDSQWLAELRPADVIECD